MYSIKEKISAIAYHHGLFCASHPFAIILGVIGFVSLTCYPLTRLPPPGNAPLEFSTPLEGYRVPTSSGHIHEENISWEETKRPRWYVGPPLGYVQQLVVKATVSPWQPKRLVPTDAFRAPLSTVFDMLDQINNFQFKDGDKITSLGDYCYHVSETLTEKQVRGLFPEYNCLVISPGNLWRKNKMRFNKDEQIIQTVYKKYGQSLDTPHVKDVLFGLSWKDTGITRFYIRNRQRVISYAITIIFQTYQPNFISSLKEKLYQHHPLSAKTSNSSGVSQLTHIHFRDINYFIDYTPLMVTYFVLFLYLYFSVRKIELVKSKWGLALSAVATVIASLLMSVGICTFFGLTPSLSGGEIFPYLVVIIGLENVLVLTKSVVSTPVHLDVKIRVAEGLSKEGWHIFKNLAAELLILLFGFFTFVPAIQEFCLFAVVGLLSDFFLQMVFFTTVLSIDIRRMELTDLHKQSVHQALLENPDLQVTHPPLQCPVMSRLNPPPAVPANSERLHRSKSMPRLHIPLPPQSIISHHSPPNSPRDTDDFFPAPLLKKLPKRLRVINFIARTRMVQRGIMVCTVIWIGLLVYKTGLYVEHLKQMDENDTAISAALNKILHSEGIEDFDYDDGEAPTRRSNGQGQGQGERLSSMIKEGVQNSLVMLQHEDPMPWTHLSYQHWPQVFGYYNTSVAGRYLSILPSIHISTIVSPDEAVKMRHPTENQNAYRTSGETDQTFTLKHSAKQKKEEKYTSIPHITPGQASHLIARAKKLKLYPQSQTELVVTVALGIASTILLVYFMMVLYRCMCSRNYAKWRSSWSRVRKNKKSSMYFKQIKESVPLILEGHRQEVENAVVDGPLIVSSCLGGQIRVWDSTSGECLTAIHRKSVSPPMVRKPAVGRNMDDSEADLYAEYHGSPEPLSDIDESYSTPPRKGHRRCHSDYSSINSPPREKNNLFKEIPDLSSSIDTDFFSLANQSASSANQSLGNLSGDSSSVAYSPSQPCYDPSPVSQGGYSFSRFELLYGEHKQVVEGSRQYLARKRQSQQEQEEQEQAWYKSSPGERPEETLKRMRSWSQGDVPGTVEYDATVHDMNFQDNCAPSVWCLASQDNLVVAGCGNGRIEFWDGLTGQLKCLYAEGKSGVTALCFVANRIIASRLNGTVDFLELETFQSDPVVPTVSQTLAHRPTGHVRNGSKPSGSNPSVMSWDHIIHCTLLQSVRAHQQPINSLQTEGGRVVTASQDHTLKVYRLEDCLCLYTLHGHSGGVTSLCLDKTTPLAALSGSEDSSVRLWDLLTGACVHKLIGHAGTINSLTCTLLYVISTGNDDRLCIWERNKGALLHCIQMEPGYCNSIAMLTTNLLVSGGQGCIFLWDVNRGDIIRQVNVGSHDNSVFINKVLTIGNAVVVCDYGNQLRVIHFPAVLEKAD